MDVIFQLRTTIDGALEVEAKTAMSQAYQWRRRLELRGGREMSMATRGCTATASKDVKAEKPRSRHSSAPPKIFWGRSQIAWIDAADVDSPIDFDSAAELHL